MTSSEIQSKELGQGREPGRERKGLLCTLSCSGHFRIHQEAACYETKEFGSALHVTGRDQIISLSLKQSAWTVPVPVLKNSGMHFLPPGAAAFSRERENSS